MHHLRLRRVSKPAFKFGRRLAAQQARFRAGVVGQATCNLHTVGPAHRDHVTPRKIAIDGRHAGRQQALAATQCPLRTGVDHQRSGGTQRAGNPLLARRGRRLARQEPGATRALLDATHRMPMVPRRNAHVAARGHGQGRRLLQHCIDTARQLGYRRCYLETLACMAAAQHLYVAAGFAGINLGFNTALAICSPHTSATTELP